MKSFLLATALSASASIAFAAERYTLDASHSQVLFSYSHIGFSTTFGLFSGFEGEILFDQEDPANSSVSVSMPTKSMFTGWEQRDAHLMSADFFDAADEDVIAFTSTSIELTGEDTALITGELTLNDITKSVVLNAILNQVGTHPMANKKWLGFDATATVLRSDYGLGAFAPAISDEVQIQISIKAGKAAEQSG